MIGCTGLFYLGNLAIYLTNSFIILYHVPCTFINKSIPGSQHTFPTAGPCYKSFEVYCSMYEIYSVHLILYATRWRSVVRSTATCNELYHVILQSACKWKTGNKASLSDHLPFYKKNNIAHTSSRLI